MKEIWLPVKDYEDLYEVSDMGRVKSLPKSKHTPQGGRFTSKEKIMKLSLTRRGYLIVTLSKQGTQLKIRYTIIELVTINMINITQSIWI